MRNLEDHKVIAFIEKERERQYEKWGDQIHTDVEWESIFNEEFAEFKCKLICGYEQKICLKELIESIAVLCAWAKQMVSEENKK